MDSAAILGGITSLFVLIAFNAFFVLAEYSLAVSRPTRIAELAEQGSAAAKLVQRLMREPDRFFAATQIGITLMSIGVGIVSEPAFTAVFGLLFHRFGVVAEWWNRLSIVLSAVVGLLVASYFQIVLAELIPRAIALRSAERIALVVVPPMHALSRALRPFIWLLKTSSRLVLRVLGFKTESQTHPHSIAELKMLVEASERGGVIESEQRDMLEAVFTFGDTTVRSVMVPRTEMICIDVETPLTEVVHQLSLSPISRLPVYEESIDHIIGVLHSKDLIRIVTPGARSITVRQLIRPAFFVPDTQRTDELLRQFQAKREHLAIVLDEYGGTAGLVSLYDLVSEIVGDVGDAMSGKVPDIEKATDGSALISGLTSLGDVNDAFDLNLVDTNYDTIGGFVMGQLGRVPKPGDEITLSDAGVLIAVDEMDKLRVARVRLKRPKN